MKHLSAIIAALLALSLVSGNRVEASDLAEGEALYATECKLCHGSLSQETGSRLPVSPPQGIQVATLQTLDNGTPNFLTGLIPAMNRSVARPLTGSRSFPMQWSDAATDNRLAFAPPFGPNLRGVVGRPAGTVEGFTYSNTMLKTLKGMEWTEAALNVWITSPQAWVPGVYMYYKQDNPEVRRKIILYLKANP